MHIPDPSQKNFNVVMAPSPYTSPLKDCVAIPLLMGASVVSLPLKDITIQSLREKRKWIAKREVESISNGSAPIAGQDASPPDIGKGTL